MAGMRMNNLLNGDGTNNTQASSSANSTKGDAVRPTNARQDFMAFYNGGTSLPVLKEGCYTGRLISHQFVPEVVTINKIVKAYVKLDLQLPDRIITDNRFETNFNLALDQVKEQLGLQDEELPVQKVLDLMKSNDIKIWISYADVEGKTYRNVNYIPPKVVVVNSKTRY